MKSTWVASVSLAVLALGPATAQTAPPAMTVDGAREFIAAAEKDLLDHALIQSRADWVNNTYVNDDSDAVAAYFGAIGTEKGVRYAKQAARFAAVPGLDADTKRKLDLLRGGLGLAAPETAARRPSSTPSPPGCSQPTSRGAPAWLAGPDRRRRRSADGQHARPRPSRRDVQSGHQNTGRPMKATTADGRDRQRWREGIGRCRHRRDVAFEVRHVTAAILSMYERLLGELDRSLQAAACYNPTKLNQKYGNAVQSATGPIRADLLGNMLAQEWAIFTTSSRRGGRRRRLQPDRSAGRKAV